MFGEKFNDLGTRSEVVLPVPVESPDGENVGDRRVWCGMFPTPGNENGDNAVAVPGFEPSVGEVKIVNCDCDGVGWKNRFELEFVLAFDTLCKN